MRDVDCLDLLAQELGSVLESEQREALEMLLRGKDVFCVLPTALFVRCLFMQRVLQVLCNDRQSLLSRLCKEGGSVENTWLLPHAKIIFSLSSRLRFGGKRFDWANVNFGRLLNIFHTEGSWHAYWFSLVGMIYPLMEEHFLFSPLKKCKVIFIAAGFE